MIARATWDQMSDDEKFSFLYRYLLSTETQIADLANAIDLLRERLEKAEKSARSAP